MKYKNTPVIQPIKPPKMTNSVIPISYHRIGGFVNRPLGEAYSVVEGASIYSGKFRYFTQSEIFPFIRETLIKTGVSVVLFVSNPPAIPLRVVPVYIYAVKAKARFIGGKHIISKFLKRVPKTLNSPTSVKVKVGGLGVITSFQNPIIDMIKLCRIQSVAHVSSWHGFFTRKGHTLSRMWPSLVLSC